LPFSDIQISRTLGIVTRRGAPLTAAAQAMRDQIITALRRDD
jgi:type II secretory pathway component PulF